MLDCDAPPHPEEYSDGFSSAAGSVSRSRSEPDAYRIKGTSELDGFVHITSGKVPVAQVLSRSREKGVTLTEYLVTVLIESIAEIQYRESAGSRKKLKPVKCNVPINLRRFFKVNTKRNFASYVNPGIDPNLGKYDFDEILSTV
ncbi:MAG: alcohol acetyltransferase, partial [Oscillospiraceae bacterium]